MRALCTPSSFANTASRQSRDTCQRSREGTRTRCLVTHTRMRACALLHIAALRASSSSLVPRTSGTRAGTRTQRLLTARALRVLIVNAAALRASSHVPMERALEYVY